MIEVSKMDFKHPSTVKYQKLIEDSDNDTVRDKYKKLFLKELFEDEYLPRDIYQQIILYIEDWSIEDILHVVFYLEYLADLINDSADLLITLNENLHNKNAYHFMKLKKERLIQISVLSHHYLNSLYALFGSYSTVSAQVILRAMIELHINSSYMYLTPNNENLNKLMVSEIELGLKGVKSLLSIYKKSGRKTATKTYQSTYKLLVSRKKHWGGIPAPSVIERARQYDKKRNSTLLEEGYLFWYGKFSAPVHANSTILNRLMRGKAITIVGMLEDFQEVIELACMHHLSILELLDIKVNKNRKTTKLMFQKFDKILETPRYKTTA